MDLDKFVSGMHNCLTDPVDILLEHGITLKQCDIRPANSLNTAFQLIAVNFQVQSLEQFGGISASHLDWSMVPYFRKSFFKHYNNWCDGIPLMKWAKPNIDSKSIKHVSVDDRIYTGVGLLKPLKKMIWNKAWNSTLKELRQATEAMSHNLNSLQSRSGAQLPFSSINYGTCTLKEGREIIRALINMTLEGTGKYHRTAIFPCCIFQYSKEIHGSKKNPGPNNDLFRLSLKNRALKDLLNFSQSTYCAFAKWLSEHPDYEDYLSLEGYYDCIEDHWEIKVKPAEKFTRYEVMSTMGKCNTTAHLKPLEPCLMGVAA